MNKVYWLSDSSFTWGDSRLCEPLFKVSKELKNLSQAGYIAALAHVAMLESGFVLKTPLRKQWKDNPNYIRLLYGFKDAKEAENADLLFTLCVNSLGTIFQILLKGNVKGNGLSTRSSLDEDSSSSMFTYELRPSKFIDHETGKNNPISLRNMNIFCAEFKNSVVLPMASLVKISQNKYPGSESLEILPNEIIADITTYLKEPRSLLNLGATSKRIQGVTHQQKILWKKFFQRDFPLTFEDMTNEEISSQNVNWREKYREEAEKKKRSSFRLSSFVPVSQPSPSGYRSPNPRDPFFPDPRDPFSPRFDPPFPPDSII